MITGTIHDVKAVTDFIERHAAMFGDLTVRIYTSGTGDASIHLYAPYGATTSPVHVLHDVATRYGQHLAREDNPTSPLVTFSVRLPYSGISVKLDTYQSARIHLHDADGDDEWAVTLPDGTTGWQTSSLLPEGSRWLTAVDETSVVA